MAEPCFDVGPALLVEIGYSVFLQMQVQPQPLPCGLLLLSFIQGASGGGEGGYRPTLIEVSIWRHLWGMSPDPAMSGLS